MYPVLLQLGPFALHTLWISIAIAIVVAGSLFAFIAKRERLSVEPLLKHGWSLVLCTLIGSRFIFIICNYDLFWPEQAFDIIKIFFIWDRGLSLWGGVLFFLVRFFMLFRKEKELLLRYADALCSPFFFGYAIGKIGAFFDGTGFGVPTELPWGIAFESANVPYTVPIHPTQLYAVLYAALIGTAILFLIRRYPKGHVALLAVWAFAVFRFLEEFVRGDDVTMVATFRLSQILAAALVIALGYFIYKERKIIFTSQKQDT